MNHRQSLPSFSLFETETLLQSLRSYSPGAGGFNGPAIGQSQLPFLPESGVFNWHEIGQSQFLLLPGQGGLNGPGIGQSQLPCPPGPGVLNGPEIGQSIDDKMLIPAVSSTSLPRVRLEGSRPDLKGLNGPEVGKSIDDSRREMETGTKMLTPAVSRTSSKLPLDEGDSEEIREKTPMPKEQETRTTRKENGVRKYRGVRQRRTGKFGAEIRDRSQQGDRIWLGTFDSAEEAAHAYDRKAYEIHGSKAVLNFPRDDAVAFPTVEKPKGNASQSTPLPHHSIREISESEQQHDDLSRRIPAASLHAHQHKGWRPPTPEHASEQQQHDDMHPEVLGEKEKGVKRREMSFEDTHPEVQGEMEKRRKEIEIRLEVGAVPIRLEVGGVPIRLEAGGVPIGGLPITVKYLF